MAITREELDSTLASKIDSVGNKEDLNTTDKSSVVAAINENKASVLAHGTEIESLKQSSNNCKNIIATAIGTPLTSNDAFMQMGAKIDTLTNTFKTNLTAKGVTVDTNDKMSTLINKIPNIPLGRKWATGLVDITSLTYESSVIKDGNTIGLGTQKYKYIDIRSLDFEPSLLVLYNPGPAPEHYIFYPMSSLYVRGISTFRGYRLVDVDPGNYEVLVDHESTTYRSAKIYNNGFSLPTTGSGVLKWEAYE